jgi:acetylornithine deacetylase/succinyl-diaminopimelate desuccinylase-like protein
MDHAKIRDFVAELWRDAAVPELVEYIRIPNKSPLFDPDWRQHGYMDEATARFERWSRAHAVAGMTVEIVELPDRTPLLYMEVPGQAPATVLLYGHLDKQPEMHGWRSDLGPWQPVLEDDRLYGRGAADDGYAMFAALIALRALAEQRIPRARCVILIEACEESGSFDLPHYIDALANRIGTPDLVICLDSGCGNYDQLWCTTSLRGLVGGVLRVEVLEEGVHSGDASGIVPSSFRVLRLLLDRLEDAADGNIRVEDLHVDIPPLRRAQAEQAAAVLGDQVYRKFPLCHGTSPISDDPARLILNRTWRPALEIIGASDLPGLADAGNVLRPGTALKISLRLPPTCDAQAASGLVRQLLEADPPYGARVTFTPDWSACGWHAPDMPDWLTHAIDAASQRYFGRPAVYMGEGGSIPFMAMLGERYPGAQFLVTGVLGPHANAHGPNEFLHLPTAQKLTCCIADVIAAHYRETARQ